ncbi:hypothetical protein HOG21_06620 [bacterium]|jgi:glycosyltransferase involved in cell wall biosynthesis|nr:hypothetical protein [bacterium]
MWDWTNEYKRDISKNKFIHFVLNIILNKMFLKLRQWDYMASNRHDITISNSQNTANRVKKYYKKESIILFPPIETERFAPKTVISTKKQEFENYYIIISALTEFKKIEIAIKAFNQISEKKLVII